MAMQYSDGVVHCCCANLYLPNTFCFCACTSTLATVKAGSFTQFVDFCPTVWVWDGLQVASTYTSSGTKYFSITFHHQPWTLQRAETSSGTRSCGGSLQLTNAASLHCIVGGSIAANVYAAVF